jgi:hypothetical protein
MAGRKSEEQKRPVKVELVISAAEASARITRQIEEGEALVSSGGNRRTYDELSRDAEAWQAYTWEFLRRAFTTEELAEEFRGAGYISFRMNASPAERRQYVVT